MAMVLVLSIYNGFTDLALSQLSIFDPDVSIVPARGSVVASADSLARAVSTIPGVESALPVVTQHALLDDGVSRLPVMLKGVPEGYDTVSTIDGAMIAGQYAESTSDGFPAVQLSVGVANRVNVFPSPDSHLNIYVPRRYGRINPANPAASFRGAEMAYSGVFRVGNSDIDMEYVLMPLSAARDLLDYDTEASSVEVRVAQGVSVGSVESKIARMVGKDYRVLGRMEQRADSFRMISIEKWVTFMMLIFILVIALFNVVSTLSLLAIEKEDNMWTLRALGAPARMIRNIFIAEGFLVTSLGGVIGIAAGVVLALGQQIFHFVKLSADASSLTIDYYPVRVDIADLLAVAAVILVLAGITAGVARLITSYKKKQ